MPQRNYDERLLRAAFMVARRAREGGDHPFGSVLADSEGTILREAGQWLYRRGAGPHGACRTAPRLVGGQEPDARTVARLHALHLRRALCDVRRRDLLGRDRAGRLWADRARPQGADRRTRGESDTGFAVPSRVRGRPAPDRARRSAAAPTRPPSCRPISGRRAKPSLVVRQAHHEAFGSRWAKI